MRGAPQDEELATYGLTLEDVAEQFTCEVWPDVMPAVNLFIDVMTQWRLGPAGPIGLEYSSILAVMNIRGVEPTARASLFDDLRVMEIEALKVLRSRNK